MLRQTVIVVILFLSCVRNGLCECRAEDSKCEVYLVVRETLTMTWQKTRTYAFQGKLYKFDELPHNATTEIPVSQVISADGILRVVVAVNGSVPGPAIIVYENQVVRVQVKNEMMSDSVTIHWHGLHQRGSPFMDGVAYITQCPITAGQTFTYEFLASPKGTFWYHSHIGGQRVDGLFGAFIIKERPRVGVSQSPQDLIMHVGDWFHEPSMNLYWKLLQANFKSYSNFSQAKTHDGVYFAPIPFVSGLIEGRGRFKDPVTGRFNEAPLKKYDVQRGSMYRFRVIAHGTIFPFRVSVDAHRISILATDGYDVRAMAVESFIINPGERYDFLLHANESVDNYWIRAQTIEANQDDHHALAILHYDGAPATEPTSSRRACTQGDPCIVLNCPYSYYPSAVPFTECRIVQDLDGADDGDLVPEFESDSEEIFMNFALDPKGMNVNGRHFEFPGASSLTQPEEVEEHSCHRRGCGDDVICFCNHEVALPFNKTIQLVWSNHGVGATRTHPIHMHGHSFHVIKMVYPPFHPETAAKQGDNSEIYCGNTSLNYCNSPRWSNPGWSKGKAPGFKLKNAPRKDTLVVPTGGYVVVRIRSDNPGKWLVHCHIEMHAMQGMSVVLQEARDRQAGRPKGFPVCQNFYNDPTRDVTYDRVTSVVKPETGDDVDKKLIIIAAVFGGLFGLESLLVSIYFLVKSMRKSSA